MPGVTTVKLGLIPYDCRYIIKPHKLNNQKVILVTVALRCKKLMSNCKCRSHNSQLVPGVAPNHAYAPSPSPLGSMGSLAQAVINRVRGVRGDGDSPRAEPGRRTMSLLSRGGFRRDSCPSTPLAGVGSGQDPSSTFGAHLPDVLCICCH